jgi:hypothetical protein
VEAQRVPHAPTLPAPLCHVRPSGCSRSGASVATGSTRPRGRSVHEGRYEARRSLPPLPKRPAGYRAPERADGLRSAAVLHPRPAKTRRDPRGPRSEIACIAEIARERMRRARSRLPVELSRWRGRVRPERAARCSSCGGR